MVTSKRAPRQVQDLPSDPQGTSKSPRVDPKVTFGNVFGPRCWAFGHNDADDKFQNTPRRRALEPVCMFENPLPVMENETYTLEHELDNST